MDTYTPLVRVSTPVDAAPTRVWHVLTRQTGVMFMGAEVTTDWREGSPIYFKGEWKGTRYEDKGVVQAFEPERKLAFTHFSAMAGKPDTPENYSLVTVDIEPDGKGTLATLTQSMHEKAARPGPDTVEEFERNWQIMLRKLKDEAER